MRFLRLVYANIRRLLAQPINLLMIILLPALILVFQNIILSGDSNVGLSLVVNEDLGEYGKTLLEGSKLDYTTMETRGEALGKLEDYESEVLYVIPADYSEKLEQGLVPEIERFSVQDTALYQTNDSIISQAVQTQLQSIQFEKYGLSAGDILNTESSVETTLVIADYVVSFDYIFSMIMIVYFILVFSSNTGTDLLELRTQRVTSRMFVTPNSSFEILASLSISYFLLTFVGYGVVVIIARFLFNMKDMPIGMTLLIIGLSSLFALSMSLFLAKITKNKQIISLVPVFYGMVGFLGAVFSFSGQNNILTKVALISPPYWFVQMMMYGDILINGGIVLLMTLVLLTAGSYNFQKFVED